VRFRQQGLVDCARLRLAARGASRRLRAPPRAAQFALLL